MSLVKNVGNEEGQESQIAWKFSTLVTGKVKCPLIGGVGFHSVGHRHVH